MLRETVLLCLLIGVALTADSANRYVDSALEKNLYQELQSANLLPAQVPDFTVALGFDKNNKNYTEVDFTFGNITGLDKIKRVGDCSGPKNYDLEISINCTLSLFPLQSSHKLFVRNPSFVKVGKVQADVKEILVDLKIVGRPQNYLGLLKKFEVGSLQTFTPVFSNIPSYIRSYLPYLQNVYQRHVVENLSSILSQKYTDCFRRAIAFKPMPRQ